MQKKRRAASKAALKGWTTRRANQRIAAAKRGWETRRANQRIAAAKRGWETRRANAEHAKRSAAAKKGWETRRRNQAARQKSIVKYAYKRKKGYPRGEVVEFEAVYIAEELIEIHVKKYTYTKEEDLEQFTALIESSEIVK